VTDRPFDDADQHERHGRHEEHEGPVIRDRRRLDPETGAVRETAAPAGGPVVGEPDAPAQPAAGADGQADGAGGGLEAVLAERTADLQRLQAEYTNYRRRVERDREAVREQALANVLTNLLPVLDDIGRAREHGELEGGFKSVAEALEAGVGKLGLERFGEPGEPFDPAVHEAMTHSHSADVTEPTCVQVFQPGYRIGTRVVRPARVAVAEPE
jgi:molecular chaperone GrpE